MLHTFAEAVGMSLDHVSVVKALHQPCSNGKRQDKNKFQDFLIYFLLIIYIKKLRHGFWISIAKLVGWSCIWVFC
jgi:hypothetical protein